MASDFLLSCRNQLKGGKFSFQLEQVFGMMEMVLTVDARSAVLLHDLDESSGAPIGPGLKNDFSRGSGTPTRLKPGNGGSRFSVESKGLAFCVIPLCVSKSSPKMLCIFLLLKHVESSSSKLSHTEYCGYW